MVDGRALNGGPTNFPLATPRELLSCFIAAILDLNILVSLLNTFIFTTSPSRIGNDL